MGPGWTSRAWYFHSPASLLADAKSTEILCAARPICFLRTNNLKVLKTSDSQGNAVKMLKTIKRTYQEFILYKPVVKYQSTMAYIRASVMIT